VADWGKGISAGGAEFAGPEMTDHSCPGECSDRLRFSTLFFVFELGASTRQTNRQTDGKQARPITWPIRTAA